MARVLRILRWPVALIAICIALAVFVYFLMPDNLDSSMDFVNGTYWEPVTASAQSQGSHASPEHKLSTHIRKTENTQTQTEGMVSFGTKTSEIDFYDAENDKDVDFTAITESITETNPHSVLPIKPVFPSHITPEVQYGNERADSEKLRASKALEEGSTLPDESTLKPHITQKPEKPLAVYFKDANEATTINTESITRAETGNEFATFGLKPTTKKVQVFTKAHSAAYKEQVLPQLRTKPLNIKQYLVTEPHQEIPPEVQQYYGQPARVDMKFTSGHSKLFGISIEDAERMRSTTQSSLYNTRVSPTLPTWRDGDDTTTKKYPVNVNYEVPQCRSTRLPLCRGILPYDLAGTPATIGGIDVTSLMSQIEYLVATNCSERVRHFTCALLEPECNPPPYPPKMPCYNLCKAIVDSCDGMIPRELSPAFSCQRYGRTNCVTAKAPCYDREFQCRDGSCVPRDWVCDGRLDCSGGEDEATCVMCDKNEYRCNAGGCILKQWLCDGYADCPGGEDEVDACDHHQAGEPGEESAGSAPAPAVRRPNRLPVSAARSGDLHRTGENDNSKELLITSDSSNAYKRNFTRRPSSSRLTPYSRPLMNPKEFQSIKKPEHTTTTESVMNTQIPQENIESLEDVNVGDLGFFEEFKKTGKEPMKSSDQKIPPRQKAIYAGRAPPPPVLVADVTPPPPTKLDKSINKLEKVINGAALLKKAQAAEEPEMDSPESNNTTIEKNEDIPMNMPTRMTSNTPVQGSISAHISPCPSGELRCVDGRCITLAQLCDGTIDCTDHADEDNCYT